MPRELHASCWRCLIFAPLATEENRRVSTCFHLINYGEVVLRSLYSLSSWPPLARFNIDLEVSVYTFIRFNMDCTKSLWRRVSSIRRTNDSDAWISIHFPLKFCRYGHWASGSRISSPFDYDMKGYTGLEHPAQRPIVGICSNIRNLE